MNKLHGNARGRQKEQAARAEHWQHYRNAERTQEAWSKKKPRNLPPATQEVLGLCSTMPFVVADVTLSGSQPPSPMLMSVSAMMYELGEAIPALK